MLRVFVTEAQRHHGELLYEWILERARALAIPGGSAFRAIAGYGRHGILHEQGFFELAGSLPVQLEFLVTDEQARALLDVLREERLDLVYALQDVEFGQTGQPR